MPWGGPRAFSGKHVPRPVPTELPQPHLPAGEGPFPRGPSHLLSRQKGEARGQVSPMSPLQALPGSRASCSHTYFGNEVFNNKICARKTR